MPSRVTLLGSGTSTGVPVIGCRCAVCTSDDPRNRRLRPGFRVDVAGGTLVVDTSTDFREQALRDRLERIDAVLYTHAHADHVFGLDDLRGLTDDLVDPLPVAAAPEVVAELTTTFPYLFVKRPYPGLANLRLVPVSEGVAADVGGFRLETFAAPHGRGRSYGVRVGPVGVLLDCHEVPDSAVAALRGVDVLVLDLLQQAPHPTHLHRDAAVAAALRVGARETWFVHMSHDVAHAAVDAALPAGLRLAYDGLVVVTA